MEKIFAIADLKANTSTTTNPDVVIPNWILDSIIGLCALPGEWSGFLVCFNKIVQYPYISGSGGSGSVFPSKKIVFNDSPAYMAIEFHTHPSLLGEHWASRFSSGDLATFSNRLKQEGEQYKHILFTTTNILTWGKGTAPDVRVGFGNDNTVVKTFNEWNKKYNSWGTAE